LNEVWLPQTAISVALHFFKSASRSDNRSAESAIETQEL
jgi:hypothetical protein